MLSLWKSNNFSKHISNLLLEIIKLVKYLLYSPSDSLISAGISEGILFVSNSFVIDNQLKKFVSNW